jgi:hypothetical protein
MGSSARSKRLVIAIVTGISVFACGDQASWSQSAVSVTPTTLNPPPGTPIPIHALPVGGIALFILVVAGILFAESRRRHGEGP